MVVVVVVLLLLLPPLPSFCHPLSSSDPYSVLHPFTCGAVSKMTASCLSQLSDSQGCKTYEKVLPVEQESRFYYIGFAFRLSLQSVSRGSTLWLKGKASARACCCRTGRGLAPGFAEDISSDTFVSRRPGRPG
eukprot:9209216-Pyramimonas_sp.AAC.1